MRRDGMAACASAASAARPAAGSAASRARKSRRLVACVIVRSSSPGYSAHSPTAAPERVISCAPRFSLEASMVLTKPELLGSLQHEVRILLHLAGKIDRHKLDYRPTP